jgi:cytochrome c
MKFDIRKSQAVALVLGAAAAGFALYAQSAKTRSMTLPKAGPAQAAQSAGNPAPASAPLNPPTVSYPPTQQPVAMPPLALPPPGTSIPPGTFAPGPAPGVITGAAPPTSQEAGPSPQTGAPGLGGALGPGATPNPGGVPAPYATPGPEEALFAAPPNPANGRQLILRYGCGSCHTIGPIREARGLVGPPLTGVADRVYIAGVLQNTQSARAMWIQNPQAFVPNVAMPNLGLTRTEAEDISAYLQTLR